MATDAALAVACPKCGAAPGQPCDSWRTATGVHTHVKRYKAVQQLPERAYEAAQKAKEARHG